MFCRRVITFIFISVSLSLQKAFTTCTDITDNASGARSMDCIYMVLLSKITSHSPIYTHIHTPTVAVSTMQGDSRLVGSS